MFLDEAADVFPATEVTLAASVRHLKVVERKHHHRQPSNTQKHLKVIDLYSRGAQHFWAKGRSVLFLVRSRPEDKIMS